MLYQLVTMLLQFYIDAWHVVQVWVGNQFLMRSIGNPSVFVMESGKYFFGVMFAAYFLYQRKCQFKERLKKQCPNYRINVDGTYMEDSYGKRIESW